RVFKRVNPRPLRPSHRVSLNPGACQAPRLFQSFDVLNVDPAPVALRLARCETVSVTDVVHAFLKTVNPAETQSFIHGLGVSHSAFAGILPEKADPELAPPGMIHLQPASKFGCRFEIV